MMWDNPAFNLYAMEQEGLLDTRESKINKVINKLRYGPRDIDLALAEVGWTRYDITSDEFQRIQREVFS